MVVQARGIQVLHGSGFVGASGAIALCADSGIGKSTFAYGMAQRGYRLCSDDAVAFQANNGAIHTVPLPFEIHLRPSSASYFGLEEASHYIAFESDTSQKPLPLIAICVLNKSVDLDVSVDSSRIPGPAAFSVLLKHSYCFSLEDSQKATMTKDYLELAATVPVFKIRFREGLNHLPAILNHIEALIHQNHSIPSQDPVPTFV